MQLGQGRQGRQECHTKVFDVLLSFFLFLLYTHLPLCISSPKNRTRALAPTMMIEEYWAGHWRLSTFSYDTPQDSTEHEIHMSEGQASAWISDFFTGVDDPRGSPIVFHDGTVGSDRFLIDVFNGSANMHNSCSSSCSRKLVGIPKLQKSEGCTCRSRKRRCPNLSNAPCLQPITAILVRPMAIVLETAMRPFPM